MTVHLHHVSLSTFGVNPKKCPTLHTSVVRAAHQRRKLKRTEEVESKRRDYDYQVKGAVDRFYMMALSNRGLGKVDLSAIGPIRVQGTGNRGPGNRYVTYVSTLERKNEVRAQHLEEVQQILVGFFG